ncbi:hypothetical protein JDW19_00735 [Paenibacillus polymyxa]|uniref:Uncharacterized protein n=1 Tax=Paenibacillus polymyxa TaxID=1406 RepID=A0A8I1IWM4_PAEPO|nr:MULTISPECIES: hypothetical protein [Paenibacillus]KAF6576872.1 hypothetical protein G9G53_02940 [Paenibacillus sp. EKM206P]KAF6590941.1 hypothetical protein G9G52_00725 [Paenibacillus sp. EKM205P]MBM0631665.1 hypothetical protein [Paenibacillus polymyxa]
MNWDQNDPYKEFRRQQAVIRQAFKNPVREWKRQQQALESVLNISMRKMMKQQREFKSLMESPFRDLQEQHLQLLRNMKPIADYLNQQQDIIQRSFGTVPKLLKKASKDFEQYKKLMVKLNFPPHHDMDYKDFKGIYEFYIANGEEEMEEKIYQLILNNYVDSKIKSYYENWKTIGWLKKRIAILDESITNYLEGRYHSAISTLLPQIEGIIIERGNVTGYVSQKELKRLGEEVLKDTGSFSLDDAVKLFYIDCVLDSFKHGQIIKSPLSRHAILHGADTKYGYKLNALRCILFFDYLILKLNGVNRNLDS